MASFVPEWQHASGRELVLKRVLNPLDDSHVVRRALAPRRCPADLFVEHPVKGWLALAVVGTAFAELDPSRLFASDEQAAFEQRLIELQALAGPTARNGMATLVILWACSTDEARLLGKDVLLRLGMRLVSREQFSQLGTKLVAGLLEALPEPAVQHLLGTWFPETEIAAVCTTRRFVSRDNRARLPRFFLDHDQEWAAKLDIDLAAEPSPIAGDFSVRLINGVAGSGKTLIAIQRALLLAELFPRQRILLLIHNTPIVADLLDRLQRARGAALPSNLEVLTFFAWTHAQWRRVFGTPPRMPEDARTVPQLLRQQRMRWPALKISDEKLLTELDFINEALIGDEQAYLGAARTGRGFALRADERSQVWALHKAVNDSLRQRGLRLWSALPRALVEATTLQAALRRYQHILVDEAQFFAPSWFELVKCSLAPQGQVFLCADPKQGFMRHRLSWKSAGLEVAGRTKKLRRSYRTTEALLTAATALVDTLAPGDREDDLVPDFSGMPSGTRPLLLYAASPQDVLDRLVNELTALSDEGLPLGAFLVIYGDNVNKKALYSQLFKRFGMQSVWWFNQREQKKSPPGGHAQEHLRLAYLDTATGLEAAVVFLIGVEPLFNLADAARSGDSDAGAQREVTVRKLYMALTRAARKLVLLSSQRLPASMEALFDLADGRP